MNMKHTFFGLVFVGTLAVATSDVNAIGMGHRYGGYGMGYGYDGFDNSYLRIEQMKKCFDDARTELQRLRGLLPEGFTIDKTNPPTDGQIGYEFLLQQKLVSRYEKLFTKALVPPQMTPAKALFRGLAGPEFGGYNDDEINDIWDALSAGLMCATAKEVSEFVRTKVRGVLHDKFGKAFDLMINSLSGSFERLREIVLHDGFRPFEEDKLLLWQKFVKTVFTDIDLLITKAQRDGLRGQDMTMRSSATPPGGEPETQEGDLAAQKPETAVERLWSDLFAGYVAQLRFLIAALEDSKGYYDVNDFEVFWATQIQERLVTFSDLLLETKTALDLDNNLGPSKSVVATYSTNVDNMFVQLQQCVKPKALAGNTAKDVVPSGSSVAPRPSMRDDLYGGYPQSAAGY